MFLGCRWVAVTLDRFVVHGLLKFHHFGISQLHQLAVLLDARYFGRTWDGDGALTNNPGGPSFSIAPRGTAHGRCESERRYGDLPGDGYLSTRATLLLSDFTNRFGQLDVSLEGTCLKTREMAPIVVRGEIVEGLELTRQPATAHGAISNQRNSQLAACIGYAALLEHMAGEQAQLLLDGSGRVHSVSAADRLGSDFAESVRADLSLMDQLRQCANHGLYRNFRVDARALEQVDSLGAVKNFQSLVNCCPETLGAAVGRLTPHVVSTLDTKHHAVRIFRELGKVVLDEVEGVGGRWTVEGALEIEV